MRITDADRETELTWDDILDGPQHYEGDLAWREAQRAEADAGLPESPPPTDAEIEDMARLFGLAGGDAADPFA